MFKSYQCMLCLIPLCGVMACSSSVKEQPKSEAVTAVQETEVSPKPAGATGFDLALMETARQAKAVKELRVYYDAKGQVRKSAVYHGDESKVPAPVLAVIKSKFPDATVSSYEHEIYAEHGYVYELELTTAQGDALEVSVKADGTIHYVERKIVPSEGVPNATIRQAIEAKLPGGVIKEMEIKEGPELYELRVKVNADTIPVHYFVFGKDDTLTQHLLRYPAQIELPASP